MPRSVFLGEPVRDGEPQWTEDDRAWAMALMDIEADACGGCGQPLSETTATTRTERGYVVPAHVYEADAVECAACVALDNEQKDHRENPHAPALRWQVRQIT